LNDLLDFSGRHIAQFQAGQPSLASLAAHAAAAGAAVDLAASEFSSFTAAIAKSRASDAVALVTDAAHQVCGAMGFTVEFPLQQLTRRLWAWREESGNERFWNERIGTAIANRAQRGVWGLLSDLRLMELWMKCMKCLNRDLIVQTVLDGI
jgi:acyl-CoA dehydrogenase